MNLSKLTSRLSRVRHINVTICLKYAIICHITESIYIMLSHTLTKHDTHTHTTTLKEARHGKTQVRIARHAELTVCQSFASLFRFKACWKTIISSEWLRYHSTISFRFLFWLPDLRSREGKLNLETAAVQTWCAETTDRGNQRSRLWCWVGAEWWHSTLQALRFRSMFTSVLTFIDLESREQSVTS